MAHSSACALRIDFSPKVRYNFSMGLSNSARLKFQNGGDDMATTSIADKLAKLEKKIAKRQATIAEEQKQLEKEMEEYNKLYLTALANKYKLNGKELFSAIEREHEQLEKLREGDEMSGADVVEVIVQDVVATDVALSINHRIGI